ARAFLSSSLFFSSGAAVASFAIGTSFLRRRRALRPERTPLSTAPIRPFGRGHWLPRVDLLARPVNALEVGALILGRANRPKARMEPARPSANSLAPNRVDPDPPRELPTLGLEEHRVVRELPRRVGARLRPRLPRLQIAERVRLDNVERADERELRILVDDPSERLLNR